MIQSRPHGPLRVGVALDDDIALPEFSPFGVVARQQAFGAFEGREERQALGFVVRIGGVGGGRDRTHNAKLIRLPSLESLFKLG